MSLKAPLYKIVLERSASFQHYYLMQVYPPVPLTVTYPPAFQPGPADRFEIPVAHHDMTAGYFESVKEGEYMQEWTDGVKLAVDVLVACVIVVALLVCGTLARSIMLAMDKERAASADVLEYRVARMYDNEECYAQDIVSLVLEYQGSPAVNVTTKGGAVMKWDSVAHHTPLTSANISAALNQAATYLCTLSYDANGTLASYNFKEV